MSEKYKLENVLVRELNEYFRFRGFPTSSALPNFGIDKDGIHYTLLINRKLFFFNETVVTANQIDIQKVNDDNVDTYNGWILEHVIKIVNGFLYKQQKDNGKYIHLNRIRLLPYTDRNVILNKDYYFPSYNTIRTGNGLDSWEWEIDTKIKY